MCNRTMPIASQIAQRKHLVLTTFYGVVRDEDVLRYVTEAWPDPQRAAFDELIQGRGEVRLQVSPAGLATVAEVAKRAGQSGPHRLAIVAKTEKGQELAGLFQSLAAESGRIVQAFESYERADEWLQKR